MISISLDVLSLDKSRFKPFTKKNGQKAIYADLILIETPNGKYGDFMVKQSATKEEREQRKEMPILGNGKYIGSTRHDHPHGGGSVKQPDAPDAVDAEPTADDDVPF